MSTLGDRGDASENPADERGNKTRSIEIAGVLPGGEADDVEADDTDDEDDVDEVSEEKEDVADEGEPDNTIPSPPVLAPLPRGDLKGDDEAEILPLERAFSSA